MSRTKYESDMVTLLDALEANVEGKVLAYTETIVFPAYAIGDGGNVTWESDQTYRAKVLYMGINELSAAIANSPTFCIGETDADAYVEEITLPTTTVRTSADDSDAAVDLERLMLPGAARVIPAGQLVTGDSVDPGTATGTGTLFIVVGYFA